MSAECSLTPYRRQGSYYSNGLWAKPQCNIVFCGDTNQRCRSSPLDVKNIVEGITNLPSKDWDLFKGRTRLQNVKTLAYYGIGENDTLKMLPAVYCIFLRTPTGETITLEVTQMDTIHNDKEKAFLKTDVPVDHQELMFGGRELEEDKNLCFYSIDAEFALHQPTR